MNSKKKTILYILLNQHLNNITKTYPELNTPQKQEFKTVFRQLKKTSLLKTKIPSIDYSHRILRIKYVRYADDWIILTNCKQKEVANIKDKISNWLEQNLALSLSESKTIITKINKIPATPAKFLGFNITITENRKLTKLNPNNPLKFYYKRIAGWALNCRPDYDRILKKFQILNFCNNKGIPTPKLPWTTLPDWEIVGRFNQILLGYFNFYLPMVDTKKSITRIYYILYYSCLYTLARKHAKSHFKLLKDGKITIQFDARYQTFFPFVTMPEEQKKLFDKCQKSEKLGHFIDWKKLQFFKTIELIKWLPLIETVENTIKKKYTKSPRGFYIPKFRTSEIPEKYLDIHYVNWRTRHKLENHCVLCGSTDQIENHHIKHINKGKVIGFAQVLKQLNRRQIPVCHKCHVLIHQGKYDNISLSEFYDNELTIL
jgi:nicotine oxidoreductase